MSLPVIASEVQQRIDTIWGSMGSSVFDGEVLSVLHLDINDNHLHTCIVPYRWHVAQRKDPSLRPILRIQPLAVTGITSHNDHYLLGRRALNVAWHPGMLEFAPAGGVDPTSIEGSTVNLKKAVLDELQEEMGVTTRDILSASVAGLVLYEEGLHEIVFQLTLSPTATPQPNPDEYSELMRVPQENFASWITCEDSFVPLTHFLGLNVVHTFSNHQKVKL